MSSPQSPLHPRFRHVAASLVAKETNLDEEEVRKQRKERYNDVRNENRSVRSNERVIMRVYDSRRDTQADQSRGSRGS